MRARPSARRSPLNLKRHKSGRFAASIGADSAKERRQEHVGTLIDLTTGWSDCLIADTVKSRLADNGVMVRGHEGSWLADTS